MYLGKVVIIEGICGELIFYRRKRFVGHVKVVSEVLVRFIYANERVVVACFWIKSIR